jgi:hypothetical protein
MGNQDKFGIFIKGSQGTPAKARLLRAFFQHNSPLKPDVYPKFLYDKDTLNNLRLSLGMFSIKLNQGVLPLDNLSNLLFSP